MFNENSTLTLKTVCNGKLIVHSVPHNLFPEGIGPDGETDYLTGNVMYNLASIFKYMIQNEIFEFDYLVKVKEV